MYVRNVLAACLVLTLSAANAWAARSDVADAAKTQNKRAVRGLLQQKADVNAPQSDGATALHWAVFWDDLEMADMLIGAGANAKPANRDGVTPLALAAMNGSAVMIEKLLKAGAAVNAPIMANGETALMMASHNGNVNAIKMLLDHGANVNATEPLKGTTALMWAVEQEHPAAVQALITGGADVNAKSKTIVAAARRGPFTDDGEFGGPAGTMGGLTPLVYAARQGDLASARNLVDAGADVNQTTADGWTAMLVATHNKYNVLASYLLDKGADPNIANSKGWTPLYIATDNRNLEFGTMPVRNADMDHLDWIKKLLDAGANPNARAGADTEHRTGFNTIWVTDKGATPFFRAAQSGDVTLMHLLLSYGADPNIPNADNTTPLMVAAGIGWVDGIQFEWSEQENIEALKMILALGADVNAQNKDGRTALHGAGHKGRNSAVQLLVDSGARLDIKDRGNRDTGLGGIYPGSILAGNGWLPIDYAQGVVRVGVQAAVRQGHTVELLRKLMTERGIPIPTEYPFKILDTLPGAPIKR